MKAQGLMFTMLLAVSVVMFGVNGPLFGSEGGHNDVEGQTHTDEKSMIPETVSEIWYEVSESMEKLEETIESRRLEDVHKQAFKIRDLIADMIDKSSELSSENIQKLQSSSKRVADIAELLDRYGDGGDYENTKSQYERLTKLISYIEMLYPEGLLGEHHDEENHDEESHHAEGHHDD